MKNRLQATKDDGEKSDNDLSSIGFVVCDQIPTNPHLQCT